jgi:hypothetical protein
LQYVLAPALPATYWWISLSAKQHDTEMITVGAVLGRNTSVSSEKTASWSLDNKKLTVRSFLLLLWLYCTHNSVSHFTSCGNYLSQREDSPGDI